MEFEELAESHFVRRVAYDWASDRLASIFKLFRGSFRADPARIKALSRAWIVGFQNCKHDFDVATWSVDFAKKHFPLDHATNPKTLREQQKTHDFTAKVIKDAFLAGQLFALENVP